MADSEFRYQWTPEPGPRVYERDLNSNLNWALDEGGRFFEESGSVHKALRKICRRLDELSIPYAVVGGMAMYGHGYHRFTEDVDLLVTADGLKLIHEHLEGSGYRPPFYGSKNLRDTELGVRIEFLVAGEFPGDGKPKPVAFPDPELVTQVTEGIRYINLEKLIDLKLASGMSNADRMKDIADVQELIKVLGLGKEFAESLAPYVHDKYLEIYPKQMRYVKLVPLTATAEIEAMLADGLMVYPPRPNAADHVTVVTTDRTIAGKYDMHPNDEYWHIDAPPAT